MNKFIHLWRVQNVKHVVTIVELSSLLYQSFQNVCATTRKVGSMQSEPKLEGLCHDLQFQLSSMELHTQRAGHWLRFDELWDTSTQMSKENGLALQTLASLYCQTVDPARCLQELG